METVAVTYQVPKESKEIVDALTAITRDVIDGKGFEAITGNIEELMRAADGYKKLKEEIVGSGRNEISAYLVREFWEAIDKNARDIE